MKRIVCFVLFMVVANNAFCQLPQLSLTRQAVSKINKKNWLKAEQLLRKSLRKEPANAEAAFVFAQLFLINDYPEFNIDSSQYYILQSVSKFNKSSPKEKEKLKRFPLDSAVLNNLKIRIDSAGFARASSIHTEKAYQNFLHQFENAVERKKAVELRDEVAYADALRINTYKSFADYVAKYPESLRAAEAAKHYERLLYEDQTKDGKLTSLISFIKNHPNTTYRRDVEKNIFEITTASGEPSAFQTFIKSYPGSLFIKKAQDILFYLNDDNSASLLFNDSLRSLAALRRGSWLPILKDGKFGFMDEHGLEHLAPQFDEVDQSYICGNVNTDYLITSTGVVSRSGKLILNTLAESIDDLGVGFLKVKSKKCWRLVHESGFTVGNNCLEDASVIANRFLATKEKNHWGIFTLTGKLLTPTPFDTIYSVDDVIVFGQSGKRVLKSIKEVAELADNIPWKETRVFDGIRALGQGHYLVNNGSLQGVLSSSLEYLVPLDRQVITQTPYGFLLEKNNKFRVTGITKEIDSRDFVRVEFYKNWIKFKEKNDVILFDGKNKRLIDSHLDSVWFRNKIAFAQRNDSIYVHLSLNHSLAIETTSEITFMKSVDSTRYFYAGDAKKKTIIEIASGKKIFTVKAVSVENIGKDIFLIDDENKKGLINEKGKPLLPTEYAAIVLTGKNFVSLLKDKKFGLYDLKNKRLIKPVYERNIIPYSSEKLVAFKNGFYGFVSWGLKDESKFEFEEVTYWNDSIALVKSNAQWMLYHISEKKFTTYNIKDFRFISNTEKEKIAVIHQNNHYGVISSKRGTIIPTSFNDIINLGTSENPIYFTEKFIEEADLHVVIYYNADGKVLRKQAYETHEYEKIYCEDN